MSFPSAPRQLNNNQAPLSTSTPTPTLIPTSSSASTKPSRPAAAPAIPNLGYTPFEYWKGPKPVLPRAGRPPSTALNYSIGSGRKLSSGKIQLQPEHLSSSKKDEAAGTTRVTISEMSYGREGKIRSAGVPAHSQGPSSFHVRDLNGGGHTQIELVSSEVPPPPYTPSALPDRTQALRGGGIAGSSGLRSKWNPKSWRKRTWAMVVGAIVAIIVIVVAVAVVVSKKNRYPNYTALTYSLADTCEIP